MNGMDRITGKKLDGKAHLRQSITDILTTPKGARVMLRDYGSNLFRLVDAPCNPSTLIQIYAATAQALRKWEPRFKLNQVKCDEIRNDGKITLTLKGFYLPEGKEITIEGLLV